MLKMEQAEIVVVAAGQTVLDCIAFTDRTEAAAYKRHVRRWASEKGVRVRVWATHTSPALPESGAFSASNVVIAAA
jgi:hypothetical protein